MNTIQSFCHPHDKASLRSKIAVRADELFPGDSMDAIKENDFHPQNVSYDFGGKEHRLVLILPTNTNFIHFSVKDRISNGCCYLWFLIR